MVSASGYVTGVERNIWAGVPCGPWRLARARPRVWGTAAAYQCIAPNTKTMNNTLFTCARREAGAARMC